LKAKLRLPDGLAPTWKVRDILKVLLRKSVNPHHLKVFVGNESAEVPEASGSFESIQLWAGAAELDARQKRSFEAIIAAFLLTFHDF
jgi:hypothetical protein